MSWGSRFFYPVVPLLLLPAFIVPSHDPLRPKWARVVVFASFAMAFGGVIQRVRMGPPVWWLGDAALTGVALLLFVPLVALSLRIVRELRSSPHAGADADAEEAH